MSMLPKKCRTRCERTNDKPAQSTGWRKTIFWPSGNSYQGHWLNSKPHGYGIKRRTDGWIYEGHWQHGQRHGWGSLRRILLPKHTEEQIYVGQWKDDMKDGEGKHFYSDSVYYGWWKENRRHGMGIMWYKNGSLYVGAWQCDVYHGLGVHFLVNGNRYEGHHARGYRNGEGTFYHNFTGQIQKGMWKDGNCETSLVQDEFRQQVVRPTEYPIPKSHLAEPDQFVARLFQAHINNSRKTSCSFEEKKTHDFIERLKRYARLVPTGAADMPSIFENIVFACTCKKAEPLLVLRQV